MSVSGMEISRSYTVVASSLQPTPKQQENKLNHLFLMIKIYPSGTLTPSLANLKAGKTTAP